MSHAESGTSRAGRFSEQPGTHWEAISNGVGDGLLDFLEAVAPAGLHEGCDCSLGYSSCHIQYSLWLHTHALHQHLQGSGQGGGFGTQKVREKAACQHGGGGRGEGGFLGRKLLGTDVNMHYV